MGGQQKIKQQRRQEREQIKKELMNQSKEYDDIYKDKKVHTMVFDINQKNKIKNTKPDFITLYNEQTGKIIKTFNMHQLADKVIDNLNNDKDNLNKIIDDNENKI